MSVVGLDFGNTSCVIAVARRGVIDTLQNEVGNRKTASLVAYQDQRYIGDSASAQASSNYKNTFSYIKRFLGKKTDDPETKLEVDRAAFTTTDENGRIAFKPKYEGKDEVLKPEQVAGALLYKCRQIAELGLDSKVSDVVIGCPTFWHDSQRRALLDAAFLAGLNPLRVMNETTAIALAYGLLRPLPKDETKNVCFVDVGECSTTVAVVSFVQGKLKVLGTASERHLGGRDFDEILIKHFVKFTKEKYKMDVSTDPKAMMKMRKECERVKRVLSANIQVQFAIEYLMNDTDVTGEITRDEFEAVCKEGITERFNKVCQDALTNSGLQKEDLHAIEVVGGAVRIPILQQELSAFFGKELSKTCDGDESVARGCALSCAMLSPSVKVREFEVQDITSYPVEVAWGPVPAAGQAFQEESSSVLFAAGNSIPSLKFITFKDRTQPFQIVARYADMSTLPAGTDPVIGTFIVSGMPTETPAGAMGPPKIKVKMYMNIHGVIEVNAAHLLTNYEEEVVEEAKPEPKPEEAEVKTEDKDADMKDGEAPKTEEPAAAAAAEEKMDTAPAEPKKKKTTKRENLSVESHLSGLPQQVLQACFEREAAMANTDKVIADTNNARNSLESYVLEARVRMVEQLKDFVLQDESDKFCDNCRTTEDWLYDEGDDAQKSDYTKRLADLKKVGDAVEKRFAEFEKRPQWVEGLRKEISNWETFALTTDEKYSHIAEEERSKVKEECSKVNSWLSAELAKLEKLPKHVDPNITCDQLTAKAQALSKFCSPIMNKKKPPPPKEEKKEEKPAETPAADAAADAAADPASEKPAEPAEPAAADATADAGAEAKPEADMDTTN